MVEPLDVFASTNEDSQWLGSAATMKEAIEMAVKHGVGSYFVFSQLTGCNTCCKVISEQTVVSVGS